MPVTEFVAFKLKAPYTLNDSDVRSNFQKVSAWQAEVSKYPLTFYTAVDDPTILYLVSGWETVEAHMKWIESEKNQALLQLFEPILTIIDFAHLEIDFSLIPANTELLVYRKGNTADDGLVSKESFNKDAELWGGQGKVIDGAEICYLKAYRNSEILKAPNTQWKFMPRVYF